MLAVVAGRGRSACSGAWWSGAFCPEENPWPCSCGRNAARARRRSCDVDVGSVRGRGRGPAPSGARSRRGTAICEPWPWPPRLRRTRVRRRREAPVRPSVSRRQTAGWSDTVPHRSPHHLVARSIYAAAGSPGPPTAGTLSPPIAHANQCAAREARHQCPSSPLLRSRLNAQRRGLFFAGEMDLGRHDAQCPMIEHKRWLALREDFRSVAHPAAWSSLPLSLSAKSKRKP